MDVSRRVLIESNMTGVSQKDRIDYLVNRTFPFKSVLLPPPGSGVIEVQETLQVVQEKIASYRAELEAKSSDELQALYEQEKKQERQQLKAKAAIEDQQRFFNQPHADADFEHWSKAAYWTLEEAIALAFGKAPEVVTLERLTNPPLVGSPFVQKYTRVRELALRAKAWGQLYDPVLPGLFLAWAKRLEIEVPGGLIEQVENRGTWVADWRDMYEKLNVTYDVLVKKYRQLLEEHTQLLESQIQNNSANKDKTSIIKSSYWRRLEAMALEAIDEYPSWKRQQRKVQKTGNLQDWLTETIGADNREAEIIKKVLSDCFEDLK